MTDYFVPCVHAEYGHGSYRMLLGELKSRTPGFRTIGLQTSFLKDDGEQITLGRHQKVRVKAEHFKEASLCLWNKYRTTREEITDIKYLVKGIDEALEAAGFKLICKRGSKGYPYPIRLSRRRVGYVVERPDGSRDRIAVRVPAFMEDQPVTTSFLVSETWTSLFSWCSKNLSPDGFAHVLMYLRGVIKSYVLIAAHDSNATLLLPSESEGS